MTDYIKFSRWSLGIIFAILIQTGTAIWWASSVATKLEYMSSELIELKAKVLYSSKAESTLQVVSDRQETVIKDVSAIKTDIKSIDTRVTRLETH